MRDERGNIIDANETEFFEREAAEDRVLMTDEQRADADILLRKFLKPERRPLRPWHEIAYLLDHRDELDALTRAMACKYEFAATYERHHTLRLRAVA